MKSRYKLSSVGETIHGRWCGVVFQSMDVEERGEHARSRSRQCSSGGRARARSAVQSSAARSRQRKSRCPPHKKTKSCKKKCGKRRTMYWILV